MNSSIRKQPIPPPSHPKQYRAIGLIRGKYQVSQEQLTRGLLLGSNGTAIDAVLLGRTLGLFKKHLDLEQEHLWVVYPRTKEESDNLHVQIVGVWEPETLSATETPPTITVVEPEGKIQNGYFSIRGEVIFYSQELEKAIVKIKQSPRRESEKTKFFKLKLKGTLPDKPVGHFWDLDVQLQGETLVIQGGMDIGSLPKKKPFPKREWGKMPGNDSTPIPKLKKPPLRKPSLSRPIPKKTSE
ncbi:MAG: hypothetical protein DSM107014_12365 [Gomphosphaeria aponina SAG 52.96 = DSM 107014]|uniref:Uncharacterized protein n=1 Tax=Gomphosphaeria aponina SAG 52.96 = DSM 107014 TaxID=1521640 RepID=A0A941JTI0_9CHRO|nr:hypothetical protein [Gomphosphaeria aponina SAG 52.96 = DSM 107014]